MIEETPERHPGKRLRELRDDAGLSQATLARRMKRATGPVTPGEISRWEKGESTPAYSTIAMWADALDVEVSAFLSDTDAPTAIRRQTGDPESTEYDRHLVWLREQAGGLSEKTDHLREVRGGFRDESLKLLVLALMKAEENAAMLSTERVGHRDAILRLDEASRRVDPPNAAAALSMVGKAKADLRTAEAKGSTGETVTRKSRRQVGGPGVDPPPDGPL